jgi:hypothetical protein
MGTVVTYAVDEGLTRHEVAARVAVARSLAALKGFEFGGGYQPSLRRSERASRLYFVPSETLSGVEAARLGIRGADDLFSGVVPGFSAFTRADALKAARRLLEDGPVRLKHGRGIGGKAQWVAKDALEVAAALEAIEPAELACCGLVLEPSLEEEATYSVGQVRVFDAAAGEFPGLFASRRNYDVLSGRDARGRRHSGVLEQSWRIGGASGPEVAALEAFRADPGLRAVRACSTEAYGADAMVPAVVPRGARVHFQGVDPQAGPLVKYTIVEPHGTAH